MISLSFSSLQYYKASQSGANGSTPKSSSQGKIEVGQTLDLDGFGGEVETHDGVKVTLKGILDEAKGDVVVFTYPKASTPGCKFLLTSPT